MPENGNTRQPNRQERLPWNGTLTGRSAWRVLTAQIRPRHHYRLVILARRLETFSTRVKNAFLMILYMRKRRARLPGIGTRHQLLKLNKGERSFAERTWTSLSRRL